MNRRPVRTESEALRFDETSWAAIRRILENGLDLEPVPAVTPPAQQPTLFARQWTDFFQPAAEA